MTDPILGDERALPKRMLAGGFLILAVGFAAICCSAERLENTKQGNEIRKVDGGR